MSNPGARTCPDCGSDRTVLVARGLTGMTDEANQYYRCDDCGRVTFEIISRTAREVRAERLEPGKQLREAGKPYVVRRVLKVGFNEYLVYVRPVEDPRGR